MTSANEALLLERAFHWEKSRPNDVYLTQPMGGGVVRDFTWAEVLDESRRMASYLASLELPPGSRIAILSKNCAHMIMTDLAIWMAGHVSVSLYPTLHPDTVNHILVHSGAQLLFVGKLDAWHEMRSGVPDEIRCVSYPLSPPNDFPTWNDLITRFEPMQGRPTRDADDPALIIYTSGSTGTPKGVVHSFANIRAAVVGFEGVLAIRPDDRLLSYLPLAHVFERAAIEACSLYYGCRVYFADSLDSFVADIQRARPTIFQSVPRLWLKFQLGVFEKMPQQRLATLLKIPLVSALVRRKLLSGLGLDQTRLAISGSAPIPKELIEWYRGLGLELLEGYAMSENFAYSHFSRPGNARAGYVGSTLPEVEHRISEEGEILVRTPTNMVAYYQAPDLTDEAFTSDGFLKTGDRGDIDEEGRLRITGRVKELFKTSKGKYVAPAPIENVINASPLIEASCVAGVSREQPHALVMLSEELRREISREDARERIAQELSELLTTMNEGLDAHERIRFIAIVMDEWQIENGFLTPTMKIKRDAIEGAYEAFLDEWYAARKPILWHS